LFIEERRTALIVIPPVPLLFGRCEMRIPFISLTAAAALALGGCAYGDLGMGLGGYGGYGSGYGGYGSGYGYGSPYYGASYGYGSPYYGSSYGYSSPYYGWNNNYYYPGTGAYVYNSYRQAYPMSTTQRAYWSSRQPVATRGATTTRTANWSGFNRRANNNTVADRQTARENRQAAHQAAKDQRRQHP
jgi:hypothetical protein